MRYSGSKGKIADEIIPIITEHLTDGMWYIEPFVGGCNVFSKVRHMKKLGADNNKYVIDMWKAFQEGKTPVKDITKEMYLQMKDVALGKSTNKFYPGWLIGYAGNACSYGSAWFNGYSGINNKRGENHIEEAYNNVMKQLREFEFLKESTFLAADYKSLTYWNHGGKSVIYCDPPYANTKGYAHDFNNEEFWDWTRLMAKNGNYIYVSEYEAPEDFKCVWMKERKDGMKNTKVGEKQNTKTEKLFVYDT